MRFSFGFLTGLSGFFRSRYNLSLEICALRQELGVLKKKSSPSVANPGSSILDSAPPASRKCNIDQM
jgi:hypothetical protein